MSDLQMLTDMGFSREKAERALQVTSGVEPAMEWLLAHADEDIPTTSVTEPIALAPIGGEAEGSLDPSAANELKEAKSLKCDECNKLFKNQMEVEFHAAKSGHSSFSESTEEKKPLTEEEKKDQLRIIEEKLKQKRLEREENERLESLEREKNRIKSGKDMTEAKKRMEELEMQKILEQRKREKEDEKAARDRVKAQIEADKAARKAKFSAETGQSTAKPVQAPATSSTSPSEIAGTAKTLAAPKDYTNTRIQIRLQDGSTLTETFSVKEQLSAIRVFVQVKSGNHLPFGLMTSFPRKVFSEDDYDLTLESLGLVPSAVVIVTKPQ